jgi:hypothetical protein
MELLMFRPFVLTSEPDFPGLGHDAFSEPGKILEMTLPQSAKSGRHARQSASRIFTAAPLAALPALIKDIGPRGGQESN